MGVIRNLIDLSVRPVTSPVVKRTLEIMGADDVEKINTSLDRLVGILGESLIGNKTNPNEGDVVWSLGGGLGIQIAANKFTRKPGNINVDVHESNFRKIVENAERKGYVACSRGFQVYIGKDSQGVQMKRETYEPVGWKDENGLVRLARDYPNLRLMKLPLQNNDLLDFIDVHVYRYLNFSYEYSKLNISYLVPIDPKERWNGKSKVEDNGGLRIYLKYADENVVHETHSGQKISVRGLLYMKEVKEWLLRREVKEWFLMRKRNEGWQRIDEFDLRTINETLSKQTDDCLKSSFHTQHPYY